MARIKEPLITEIRVSDVALEVTLQDGREISAPIDWFPRLRDADVGQRATGG
jgi:hypothetical protein